MTLEISAAILVGIVLAAACWAKEPRS